MKKLVPILLAVVMIFTMNATLLASATNVTFGGDTTRTYDGYKLLNLTISLKADDACAEGVAHTDSCYNYSYTVNEKYLDVLKAETFANAAWTVDDHQPATANDVTAEQILHHLSVLTSDQGDTSGTLRPVADRLYAAIVEAGIAADK